MSLLSKDRASKDKVLKNKVRVVTSAALFDGHDASINIMRRILQDMGAEVIHLGHNRSVQDVVNAALQENANAIAVSSYQGGHMEYFKYMKDLLDEAGADYVKIFGGGGGVIIHEEKKELEDYGITKIFHPDDGRKLGLEGMIQLIMDSSDFCPLDKCRSIKSKKDIIPHREIGLELTGIELGKEVSVSASEFKRTSKQKPPVVGITGTGGAGKSSLVDELVQRFLNLYPEIKIGIICVDPSKKKTGGALLGDRIRMNSLSRPGVYMRSVASRGSGDEISKSLPKMLDYMKTLDFDLLIAESSGIGQASSAITEVCDLSLYVMTSEFGAQSQLEKIDMIDFADLITINKADHRGSEDALRDVKKQYRRSRKLFDEKINVPVYLSQAAQFNDVGVNQLFFGLTDKLSEKTNNKEWILPTDIREKLEGRKQSLIVPPHRQAYLTEIVQSIRNYKKRVKKLKKKASDYGAILQLEEKKLLDSSKIESAKSELKEEFTDEEWSALEGFDQLKESYSKKELTYTVRKKDIKVDLTTKSLCGIDIPKVVVPQSNDWGERFQFLKLENVPGQFPYTAGVFPLKRQGEDPIRMFAGEGSPEKTNKRFHYLSKGSDVKRLSTAFDSVTLYGQDPDLRPDIYGKVGESGVSIATLNDMKKLFDGFDLVDPKTSVSMTINGPAPIILAFFMNTAIDQQVIVKEAELGRKLSAAEHQTLSKETVAKVRGTVQADILKEDQGQNTCIFSIGFALKMMGDMQEYFIENSVRNFYSVSISGYHIAEAGANPITQLALTLSNAFTYVEYYLNRGMDINDFAPNLSFFFSNGLDPEYTVLGRVARRIWSVAMKELYEANDRSQKLKYHIQTSGRSLHAQEIDFNDIRTTLQALVAINDNCNSLHTNAYDEAITTPTEESVRRAQAIQMIINKEFGIAKNENPNQGSYFVNWMTETVEEAVLTEFQRISERGGVLGAMETQYQRGKIQEESMYYEHLKHSGEFPVVGVNTFIDPKTLADGYVPPKIELARAEASEKEAQLNNLRAYQEANKKETVKEIAKLKEAALTNKNIFEALMSASRYCSLYQMTSALYEVGGQYRRNM